MTSGADKTVFRQTEGQSEFFSALFTEFFLCHNLDPSFSKL